MTLVIVTVAEGLSSKAPESHPIPNGLGKYLWSTPIGIPVGLPFSSKASQLTVAPSIGSPPAKSIVSVGPPLSASGRSIISELSPEKPHRKLSLGKSLE